MHCIGTDLMEINRIEHAVEEWGEKFLRRIYTDSELVICKGRMASLAARFAAKEAIYKMLGGAGKSIAWKEIEILRDSAGKPFVQLYGATRNFAESNGFSDIAVSLSHSHVFATATAVCDITEKPG